MLFISSAETNCVIFDKSKQDTHSGGSGCDCIGTVCSGYFFKQLRDKKINKVFCFAGVDI